MSRSLYFVQKEDFRRHGRVNEMIGNSLLRGVSQAEVSPNDREIKVNFVFKSGAKYAGIIDILEQRMKTANTDTNYAVLMFQNNIRSLGQVYDEFGENAMKHEIEEAFEKIKVVKKNNEGNFRHNISIAEEQYPPELEEFFGIIWLVNEMIREENLKNNIKPFRLWRVMMKSKKGGFIPRVVNHRWAEYQKFGRPGYHIGEGRSMSKFSQFIRRYFSDTRNWGV